MKASTLARRLLPAVLVLPALLDAPAVLAQDAPKAPVQQAFHGKVESFKGRRIELSYDFSDAVQGKDWAEVHPFVLPARSGGWRIEGGALRGEGTVSYRLRAVFDGDVTLTATLDSEKGRDYGAAVLSEEGSTFTLFSINDAFFSLKDGRLPNEHMVTTFLPAGTGPGGSTFWRYVQTSYEPRVPLGKVEVSVHKKGDHNRFKFGGTGVLEGNDVEAKVGPELAPAFYILDSRVVVTGVKVSGLLSANWLRQNGVAFDETVKDEPKPPADDGAKPEDGAADDEPWKALVARLKDKGLDRAEREKAARDLIALKEKKAARPMIDVLYDDDDGDGRELAYAVFKGLSGKDAGYRPGADADTRVKSMDKVWAVWFAMRNLIERDEAKKK